MGFKSLKYVSSAQVGSKVVCLEVVGLLSLKVYRTIPVCSSGIFDFGSFGSNDVQLTAGVVRIQ